MGINGRALIWGPSDCLRNTLCWGIVFYSSLVGAANNLSDCVAELVGTFEENSEPLSDEAKALLPIILDPEADEIARLRFWKLLFFENKEMASQLFPKLNVSPESQASVAQFLVQYQPEWIPSQLGAWDLTTEFRLELAKAMASQLDITEYLPLFEIGSEMDMAQVAAIHIRSGYDNWEAFNIREPDALFSVYESLAKQGCLIGKELDFKSLNLDQRGEIAIAVMRGDRTLTEAESLKEIGTLPTSAWLPIAKMALTRVVNDKGWEYFEKFSSDYKSDFSIEPHQLHEIAIHLIRNAKLSRIREAELRDQALWNWYGSQMLSTLEHAEELRKAMFFRDPLNAIAAANMVPDLEQLHFQDDGETLDVRTALSKFSQTHPELIPPEFVESLWDQVQSRDISLFLLREFIFQAGEKVQSFPPNSLATLCYISGLPFALIQGTAVTKNPSFFYHSIIEIQKSLGKPAFEEVTFSAEAFNDRETFLQLLGLLRDAAALRGNQGSKDWRKLLIQFQLLKRPIGSAQLQEIVEKLTTYRLEQVQKLVAEQAADFRIPQGKLERLLQRWGDIEPILTLFSRFNAEEEWHAELPLLANIFRAILQNKFAQYKFTGTFAGLDEDDDESELAQGQLKFLSTRGVTAWRKGLAMAALLPSHGAEEAEESLATNLAKVKTRAKKYPASDLKGKPKRFVEEKLVPAMEVLRQSIAESNPHQKWSEFRETWVAPLKESGHKGSIEDLTLSLTMAQLAETPDAGGVKFARYLLNTGVPWKGTGKPETIASLLKNAESDFVRLKRHHIPKGIALNVINGDARLLLTIGNLTGGSTCQSYSSGGMIESLLAYVIDAHTQAMAGWIVRQSDFADGKDYMSLARAMREDGVKSIEFDGNLRIAKFKYFNHEGAEETVNTLPLGNAQIRRIIRVGESINDENVPGLALEQSYEQPSEYLTFLLEHQNMVYEKMRSALGADKGADVEPTRNPGGAYSDATSSIETEGFQIEPE